MQLAAACAAASSTKLQGGYARSPFAIARNAARRVATTSHQPRADLNTFRFRLMSTCGGTDHLPKLNAASVTCAVPVCSGVRSMAGTSASRPAHSTIRQDSMLYSTSLLPMPAITTRFMTTCLSMPITVTPTCRPRRNEKILCLQSVA